MTPETAVAAMAQKVTDGDYADDAEYSGIRRPPGPRRTMLVGAKGTCSYGPW